MNGNRRSPTHCLLPTAHHPQPTNFAARRGVVLLVVLALLAMFGLIAVAFLMVSGQAQRGAKNIERIEQGAASPAMEARQLLQQAAMQVLRGPNTDSAGKFPNPTSVMGAHSLLETMYGNGWVGGNVSTAAAAGGVGTPFPQLIDITVTGITATELARRGGCVLTITGNYNTTTGQPDPSVPVPCLGQSTRIVGGDFTTGTIQVTAFPSGWIPTPTTNSSGQAVQFTFVINGVPFSGTGFGYNTTTDQLDQNYDTISRAFTATVPTATNGVGQVALLPNLPLAKYYNITTNPFSNPPGGANTDYTAADFQHMLLAAQVPNTNAPGGIQTLPSMHRAALCRYWAKQTETVAPPDFTTVAGLAAAAQSPNFNLELKRAITLRPLPDDHPNFTGSNPSYDATAAPNQYASGFNPLWDGQTKTFPDWAGPNPRFSWDVDNDGDGAMDSVWVDLGMPVRSTADGRLYKPLFAILCVDLDGRLNLNAHGSLPQTAATYIQAVQPTGLNWSGTLAGSVASVTVPRGQGFGPSEVNLNYVLSPSDPSNTTVYQQLLGGASGYQGRYGTTGVPGTAGIDALSVNKWFPYAGDTTNNSAICYWWGFLTSVPPAYVRDSYGTPPDPFGVGAVALDVAGRPLWMSHMGETTADNPYELNLGPNAARGLTSGTPNNPFSAAELERILRPFDRDAPSLPARLLVLSETTAGNPTTSVLFQKRQAVTTESWDLPVPGVPMTSATTPTATNTRVADLLKARLMATAASGGGALTEAQALTLLPQLLPPDVLAGLRMDINRPFGNGRADDTTNNPGVVDAPASSTKQVTLASTATTTTSVPMSYDGLSTPGTLATDPLAARQLQAKYLYIMMLTLADRASLRTAFQLQAPATDPTGAIGAARAVAQWAINAVCFRDCDNVMIPFDYDPSYAYDNDISHRVTGWNAGTQAYRVWGCKRPELLITETLAFHDRKTEDLDDDGGKVGSGDANNNFDQRHRPQGSLFIELYNPAGPLEPPADATDTNPPFLAGTDMSGAKHYASCVRLNQTTPQGHPVWRLAIVAGADMGKDLNDPDDSLRPAIERSVYFIDPTAANITGGGRPYYPSATNVSQAAPILPGRYAVIGPAATTHVGVRTDGGALTTTRQIVLTENVDPNDSTDQVAVTHNANTASTTNEVSAVPIKPPVAVVVDQPRRLSVSEPVDGYTSTGYDGAADTYSPVLPSPLDTAAELTQTGTRANYKIVHLQRLANPRLPWNETVNMDGTLPANYNPFITIDSQPVDLTAFNGIAAETAGTGTVMFASHQRGETNVAADGANNLWKQVLTAKPLAVTPTSDNTHRFDHILQHSLGYLNTPFGPPRSDAIDPRDSATGWRSYRGDPSDAAGPFPWLTWNNRPYVSPLELLQVPWARPSELLLKYNTAQGNNFYTTSPFPHLLNLFPSGVPGVPYEELHRILDYLRVPSPFAGTETWANPTTAANTTGHAYHPPFNRISTYREPGRVNLNTIYSDEVFASLMNGITAPTWTNFVQSRRANDGGNVLDMPPNQVSPTEFPRPFRSFAGASMIPTLTGNPLTPSREINATVLREGTPGSQQPLFQYTGAGAYNNSDRNPYFRYQGLQRLSNLVTTRSNVYAVWITVGYFEVSPVTTPDTARWPDGYQLGRELGMDTGQIERHRAFYIFDRTIPVGFKRGQDLNADKAILVNRFIE